MKEPHFADRRISVRQVCALVEGRGLVRHRGRYWPNGEDDRLASYAVQTKASSATLTDEYYDED